MKFPMATDVEGSVDRIEMRRRQIRELLAAERAVVDMWYRLLDGIERQGHPALRWWNIWSRLLDKIKNPARQAFRRLIDSYFVYVSSGVTSPDGYRLSRIFAAVTRGELVDLSSKRLSEIFPPKPIDCSASLFPESVARFSAILTDFRRDGYVVMGERIPSSLVKSVLTAALESPAVDDGDTPVCNALRDAPENCQRLNVLEAQLVCIPSVLQIVHDPFLIAFAQEYLGCRPILEGMRICKTFPKPESGFVSPGDASQKYHSDRVGLRFVKVFLYLTDVEEGHGPHCYVAGTHGPKPEALWQEGRISDETVNAVVGHSCVRHVFGAAGTMFWADTAGIHKGTLPVRDSRTLLEITFCNTLFGSMSGLLPGKDTAISFDIDSEGKAYVDGLTAYDPRLATRYLLRYASDVNGYKQ